MYSAEHMMIGNRNKRLQYSDHLSISNILTIAQMCWINYDENDPPSYIILGGCKP